MLNKEQRASDTPDVQVTLNQHIFEICWFCICGHCPNSFRSPPPIKRENVEKKVLQTILASLYTLPFGQCPWKHHISKKGLPLCWRVTIQYDDGCDDRPKKKRHYESLSAQFYCSAMNLQCEPYKANARGWTRCNLMNVSSWTKKYIVLNWSWSPLMEKFIQRNSTSWNFFLREEYRLR